MNFDTETVYNGKYTVDIIKNDEYIGQQIKHGYEWDGWMREDLKYFYVPGTDILDIGANIGYNTLMASDYGPVHSFEPLFHEIVQKNVNQNNLINTVKVHPYALGDKNEPSFIYIPVNSNSGNGIVNYGGCSLHPSEYHKTDGVPIEVKRLDDVYQGHTSFVKMDAEGHEYEILQGATELLRKHRPTLLIEIGDFETQKHKFLSFLAQFGYNHIIPRPEHMYLIFYR
jgi:FkbM family methyltransferase